MGGFSSSRIFDTADAEKKFDTGGDTDLTDWAKKKPRGCTDVFCVVLLVLGQIAFIVVTLAGAKDGEPQKLYQPRDYRGAYCGVKDNWNGGPNLENVHKLSYTMNVSSAADMMVAQLICSSVARQALVQGGGGVQPLLRTDAARDKYLCDCCLSPCKRCEGSKDNGGDLASGTALVSTIQARMVELTDPSQAADLFSPAGANGQMFSTTSFWNEAAKYFNMVCLPDCQTRDTSLLNTSAYRNYTYSPPMDHLLYQYWDLLAKSTGNPLTSALKLSISSFFTFKAYPLSVCPYDASICVPMPGIEFKDLQGGGNYCSFAMAAQVVDAIGQAAANAFASIGGIAITATVTETFGQWMGDFQKTVDSFVVVCVVSFVFGVVFLVLLRFFIGVCVWIAVVITVLMFALGGAFAMVRSGQCKAASFWETGQQNIVAIGLATKSKIKASIYGKVGSEAMNQDGDGTDYRGVQTYTRLGRSCQEWDTQEIMPQYRSASYNSSDLLRNFCRNPYHPGDRNVANTIWCITNDPNIQWEECIPIGVIQPKCQYGYAVQGDNMRMALFVSAWVLWGLGIIWIVVIICFASRIRLAIALNKVGASFLAHNPHTLLVPLVQAILTCLWTLAWLFSVSFLLSQVPDYYTPKGYFATYDEAYGTSSTPGKCTDRWPTGFVWKDSSCEVDAGTGTAKCWRCAPPRYVFDIRFCISFFMYLWNQAFNVAVGQLLIALMVAFWFFTPSEKRTQERIVLPALRTTFRYHVGSVAFGSFILAVIQFLRYLMMYFEKQAQAQKNMVMVWILRVVQCCIWVFEKIVKFLNKNAYIQIAIMGTNFCTSAKRAFFLIMRNMLRFGAVAVLGQVIHGIGFLAIMTGTTVCGYFIVRGMHDDVSPVMPILFYISVSYFVAKLYMNVFGLAVDTSLQCFLAVEEMGVGGNFVPDVLRTFVKEEVETGKTKPEE